MRVGWKKQAGGYLENQVTPKDTNIHGTPIGFGAATGGYYSSCICTRGSINSINQTAIRLVLPQPAVIDGRLRRSKDPGVPDSGISRIHRNDKHSDLGQRAAVARQFGAALGVVWYDDGCYGRDYWGRDFY
jgi:hypothetical protein